MSSSAVKRILSGSTDGMPIKVAATSSPGTTIDTAVAGQTPGTYDEVWLWACNVHTGNVVLTLEVGDAGAQDIVTIPYKQGFVPIYAGHLLQNAKVIKAFASVADVIFIHGHKHSITD